jgi:gamma-D-glutamyl-L-lysine dipeptidyl-peptidase
LYAGINYCGISARYVFLHLKMQSLPSIQINRLRVLAIIFVGCLLGCSVNKQPATGTTQQDFTSSIQEVVAAYAPDQRTVLFKVEPIGNVVKGETTSAAAKAALLKKLQQSGATYIDSITVLPTAELQQQLVGVVTLSVATLRTEPSHKAELATQATLGTPVRLFKREKNWLYVQTPDNYLAWIEADALVRIDSASLIRWQQQQKIIYTKPFGFAYATPSDSATVCDLVYGNVLSLSGVGNDYYYVTFPDGRKAFVPKKDAMDFAEWKNSRRPGAENFITAAKQLTGIPYLWGGTSFKAVDCSGFTKTVYFMNGLVLPRDASQQVNMGTEIDTSNNWQNLQPGDLLFFGSHAKANAPERVVHVGMWIGNNEFIHASGKVRVNSIDALAPNFDAYELRRFLKVKRIPPEACLFDLRSKEVF